MSYSMRTYVTSGDWNTAAIYFNGNRLMETYHQSYSGLYKKYSTGGRETFLEARAGNTIYLGIDEVEGSFRYITFCVEYIP